MEKDYFFYTRKFEPKLFHPKKCVNQDKSNSRQNSVKGTKDPVSAKKMPKSNKKFQNVHKMTPKSANSRHY